MKYLISLTLSFSILAAQNYFTAEEYNVLNKTSPSLQDLIYDHHNLLEKNKYKIIFDFESTEDGSSKKEYKNYFQTKDGYKGAELQLITLKAGGENFAIIGRQFGNTSNEVSSMVHDYAFMYRKKLLSNNLDVLIGVNLHDEPKYETINNKKYFTTEIETSLKLVSSIKIYNIDLGFETNNEQQVEKLLLAYDFDTKYGSITPKVIQGKEPFKYYDSYLTYKTNNLFDDNGLYLSTMVKHRTIDDDVQYQDGVIAKSVNIEKYFKFLKIYLGYSKSTEFTDNELTGSMYKIALSAPKEMRNKRQAEFYFGSSKNYYNDLVSIRMIDQELSLFGVKLYF